LEKFQQNSLLADVNMHFPYYLNSMSLNLDNRTNISRVITKIAPFITSIDSIESHAIDLLKMVYNNNTNPGNSHEAQLLLKKMLTKTRILVTRWFVLLTNFVHEYFKLNSTGASTTLTPQPHGKIK
jgi:hypothetical protein